MNWRWAVLLVVMLACAKQVQQSDDDDGFTTGASTTGAGGGSGGATVGSTTVSSSVSSSTSASVGPGPSSSVSSVVSSSSGGGNCALEPTFTDCANCYCLQDALGCQAYIDEVNTYIYCGGECGSECSLYCSSFDPLDIDLTCDNCIANFDCSVPTTTQMQTDCNNWANGCTTNTACLNFVTLLQNCPP